MWFSPAAICVIIVPSGNVTSTGSSLVMTVPFPNCPYVLSPHVNTFPSSLKLIVWLPFVITFGDIVISFSISGTTSTWITPILSVFSWFAVTIVVPVFLPDNFILNFLLSFCVSSLLWFSCMSSNVATDVSLDV